MTDSDRLSPSARADDPVRAALVMAREVAEAQIASNRKYVHPSVWNLLALPGAVDAALAALDRAEEDLGHCVRCGHEIALVNGYQMCPVCHPGASLAGASGTSSVTGSAGRGATSSDPAPADGKHVEAQAEVVHTHAGDIGIDRNLPVPGKTAGARLSTRCTQGIHVECKGYAGVGRYCMCDCHPEPGDPAKWAHVESTPDTTPGEDGTTIQAPCGACGGNVWLPDGDDTYECDQCGMHRVGFLREQLPPSSVDAGEDAPAPLSYEDGTAQQRIIQDAGMCGYLMTDEGTDWPPTRICILDPNDGHKHGPADSPPPGPQDELAEAFEAAWQKGYSRALEDRPAPSASADTVTIPRGQYEGLMLNTHHVRSLTAVVSAARRVVSDCDLHRSDYSSLEWAALTGLRAALASHDGTTAEAQS